MKRIICILLIIIFFIGSCRRKDWHYYYYINNKSSFDIYSNYSGAYPDTTIKGAPNFLHCNCKIKHNVRGSVNYRYGFETLVDEIPSGRLIIFIYNADTVEQTPWDTIKKKYLILKRYELTFQELEDRNWEINYP